MQIYDRRQAKEFIASTGRFLTYVVSVDTIVLGEVLQDADHVTGTLAANFLDGLTGVNAANHSRVSSIDSDPASQLVCNELLLTLREAREGLPLAAQAATKAVGVVLAAAAKAWISVLAFMMGSHRSGTFWPSSTGLVNCSSAS